jgi:hypothetical protein
LWLFLGFVVAVEPVAISADTPGDRVSSTNIAALEPEEAGPDFLVQGEYEVPDSSSTSSALPVWAAQISALGRGNFRLVLLKGGLPGAGWDAKTQLHGRGRTDDEKVLFMGVDNAPLQLEWRNGSLNGTVENREVELRKTLRQSSTLNQQAPSDAVVLFNGSGTGGWIRANMDKRGFLAADLPQLKVVNPGPTTQRKFQSHRLHLEFRLPFQPFRRGQVRANSGVYLQGRYELQILDSFGVHHGENWAVGDICGEIMNLVPARVNACLPPLTWQTLDVDFKAAKFNPKGKRINAARMTVRLNGILIHDNVVIPKAGVARLLNEGATPGPLMLQDHDSPVFYRNIWIVPK